MNYKYITRPERETFNDMYYCAENFKKMVSDRYYKYGFGIPTRIKLLFWVCNIVASIVKQYLSLVQKLNNESLHR